jgi:anti-sigma regulatory factor (Ser/Thr protein kinase)
MSCSIVLEERRLIHTALAISQHVDLPGTPRAAPEARRFLRRELSDVVTDSVLHDVLLLATELVTNVIMHARTGVHLGVTYDTENVLVTVRDYSDADPAQRARNAQAVNLEESGRGMAIIATIADDFGWRRLPDQIGKVMWFVISTTTQVRIPGLRDRYDV